MSVGQPSVVSSERVAGDQRAVGARAQRQALRRQGDERAHDVGRDAHDLAVGLRAGRDQRRPRGERRHRDADGGQHVQGRFVESLEVARGQDLRRAGASGSGCRTGTSPCVARPVDRSPPAGALALAGREDRPILAFRRRWLQPAAPSTARRSALRILSMVAVVPPPQ